MSEAAPKGEIHLFPCAACGSDLEYAPGERFMRCTHCGAEQPIETNADSFGALEELDYDRAIAAKLPEQEIEETRTVGCTSCGAEFEFRAEEHAAECPFCASPIVTDTGPNRHIRPGGLLPFSLTEREAHDAMNRWLKSLWFAPSALTKYATRGRSMQGMYVPFWTFDADAQSAYTGMRGTEYRVTVGSGKNRRSETRVRWTPVSGHVRRRFDDVLVLGSSSLPRHHTDALAPWDMTQLEPYRPEFLSGFRAEAYTVDLPAAFDSARDVMDEVILQDIRRDIGGDRQRVKDRRTELSETTFKHVLLPVWIAAYRYRGKPYRFIVNARTGRVRGERPWSAWKIAGAVVLGLAVAAAVAIGIQLLETVA